MKISAFSILLVGINLPLFKTLSTRDFRFGSSLFISLSLIESINSELISTPITSMPLSAIIAAVGRPEMVKKDWVKPGAIVVDVGINRVDDSSRERGWRLAGDVHPEVAEVASLLSPVPGGVGPMTVAMLMANPVTSAEAHHS